jgi:hypothetical protein
MADMARVLITYHYGGIYLDLDFYCYRSFECLESYILSQLKEADPSLTSSFPPLSSFQTRNTSYASFTPALTSSDILVVSREPEIHSRFIHNQSRIVIQDFFFATPKHPFLKWFLDKRNNEFQKAKSIGMTTMKGPFSYSIQSTLDEYYQIKQSKIFHQLKSLIATRIILTPPTATTSSTSSTLSSATVLSSLLKNSRPMSPSSKNRTATRVTAVESAKTSLSANSSSSSESQVSSVSFVKPSNVSSQAAIHHSHRRRLANNQNQSSSLHTAFSSISPSPPSSTSSSSSSSPVIPKKFSWSPRNTTRPLQSNAATTPSGAVHSSTTGFYTAHQFNKTSQHAIRSQLGNRTYAFTSSIPGQGVKTLNVTYHKSFAASDRHHGLMVPPRHNEVTSSTAAASSASSPSSPVSPSSSTTASGSVAGSSGSASSFASSGSSSSSTSSTSSDTSSAKKKDNREYILEISSDILHPLIDSTNSRIAVGCKNKKEVEQYHLEEECSKFEKGNYLFASKNTMLVHMWTHSFLSNNLAVAFSLR